MFETVYYCNTNTCLEYPSQRKHLKGLTWLKNTTSFEAKQGLLNTFQGKSCLGAWPEFINAQTYIFIYLTYVCMYACIYVFYYLFIHLSLCLSVYLSLKHVLCSSVKHFQCKTLWLQLFLHMVSCVCVCFRDSI